MRSLLCAVLREIPDKQQKQKLKQSNQMKCELIYCYTAYIFGVVRIHFSHTDHNSNNDNNFRVDLHFNSSFDPLKMFIWSSAVDECVAKHS